MLPAEIEPFADHHIEKLTEIREALDVMLATDLTLTPEAAEEWQKTLKNAERAFYRFKVCMADEVQQKEEMRPQVLTCLRKHQ